ncbi:MAG: Holliday junction resolvase RuvX [Pseudomonadota bacterium]
MGRLLGLDPGTKTIGVAACDPTRRIATSVETIRRKKFADDGARLAALARERSAVGCVIGLPLNMDGSEGPRAQSARAFARNLSAHFARVNLAMPLLLWDERLSTAEAERALIATDTSRRRRAQVIDQQAAAIILQAVLDRLYYLDG